MGNPQPQSAPDMSSRGISDPPPPTPDKDGTRIRVLRQRLTTKDGMQQTNDRYSYFDKQLDTSCYPSPDTNGQYRCFPTPASYTNGFADSRCTVLATAFKPSCNPTKFTIEYLQPPVGSCLPLRYHLWRIGGQVSALYSGSPGACTQITPPADTSIFAVSEQISDESLALFTYTTY